MTLNYFAISSIFIALSSSIMAIFVVLNGRDKKISRLWGIFSLTVIIWGFGGLKIALTKNAEDALLWWRLTYIGIIFMPPLFFHFVCVFLNIKRTKILISSYVFAVICVIADLIGGKLFIGRIELIFNNLYWNRSPGVIHVCYFIFLFFGLIAYSAYCMAKGLKSNDLLKRNQIKYFFIGSGIGWIGGELCFLPTFGMNVYPFANFLLPCYPIIMGYAIVRHQLMDIEVIIKKTLVFTGLFAAVYAVFAFFALFGQIFFEKIITTNRWIAMIPSVFVVTFMLRPLENFLINVTNKYLFQKKYDYKELLKTFTAEVLTVLDITKLISLTIQKLSEIIKLKSCAILLMDNETGDFKLSYSQGLKNDKVTFSKPNDLLTFLEKSHSYILKYQEGPASKIPDVIKSDMARLDAEFMIPLVLHEKLIGILSLGKKKSDENYTQDDIDILLPLARTLAIAISNAELFDQLSKTQAEAAQKEKMAVIGTLSAGINHEICNPLGIARGQCEAFLLNLRDGLFKAKNHEELLARAKEIMQKVIKETDRATAITKKLSSFAKPAKGDMEAIDIEKEIEEVITLVGYELKLEKIEIEKRFEASIPRIMADKKQIQEIFFNLLRNAGQAIGEKGKIIISVWQHVGKVLIDIKDTGHGIPEEKTKELFNPFFTTKEPGKGTGLGLFIVRQVVERNNGKIYLKETKVGEGTTFTLEFPIAIEEKSHA